MDIPHDRINYVSLALYSVGLAGDSCRLFGEGMLVFRQYRLRSSTLAEAANPRLFQPSFACSEDPSFRFSYHISMTTFSCVVSGSTDAFSVIDSAA